MLSLPETRYALSGDVSIAYQIMGDGPIDMVLVPGFVSHVEFGHELPGHTAFLRRLSRFARVISFDKRGQGLSDRMVGAPTFEERMDDVRAVMESVGSTKAVIMGFSEGCAMSAQFAATYPSQVTQLILFGGYATEAAWSTGVEARINNVVKVWGSGEVLKSVIPSQASDPDAISHFAKMERLSASPGSVKAVIMMNEMIDVRPLLPSIRVPTLVLHRRDDARVPIQAGRDLASQIPDARMIEYSGSDHAFWAGDVDAMLGDIEEFVTGHRDDSRNDLERVLSTVLFTDIVNSTQSAADMGDRRWRERLDEHDDLVSQIVSKNRGNLVKHTGDGILATFDGPGRAVRCGLALASASRKLGLPIRAGLHTGEIELRGNDVGGVAVHAAARVMSKAEANEVLVSRVVTDLVAGAGLQFSTRGTHELKGLTGHWELFSAHA